MWSVFLGGVHQREGEEMRRNLLAVGAAALLATAAHAGSFEATVKGSGAYQYVDPMDAIGVPGGCFPAVDPNSSACQFGFVGVSWSGTLDVATSSNKDGTYSYGSGIIALYFSSDQGSFGYNLGDGLTPTLPGEPGADLWYVGLQPGASITIKNGLISGVFAVDSTDDETFTFNGLGASARSANAGENSNNFSVSGPLHPVPEPGMAAMLAAGVFLLALHRRQVPSISPGRCQRRRRSIHARSGNRP